MEIQPTEILEHFFTQLPNLKAVIDCFDTCARWRMIIENLFKNKAQIVVAGGCITKSSSQSPDRSYIEIIHLINPKLTYIFQDTRLSKVHFCNGGGILQNQLLICGGIQAYQTPTKYENDIVILGQQNQLLANNKLLQSREFSTSVVLNDETIWIIGGFHTETTEFVFLDKSPVKGPDMPFRISAHVTIKVDEKRIFILGGYNDKGKASNQTLIVDPTNNFDIKRGPSMKTKRLCGSGSTMKVGGKQYIVVAGGHSKCAVSGKINCNDKTELLDISLSGQEWIEGPKLPFELTASSMVTSPTGKGVIFSGGYRIPTNKFGTTSNDVYELSGNSIELLEWTILEQKLQYPRIMHASFPIPDEVSENLREYKKQIKTNWCSLM